MDAAIVAIEYHLPAAKFSNEDLVREFPEWTAEKVRSKTGIECRHIAGIDEYVSDLAVVCGRKLLDRQLCPPEEIDFLILCTQSPDYLLPTTACTVQARLSLPDRVAALDVNLGCSGYVYGLSLARSLIVAGEARNVMLLTADTYSKHMAPHDFGVRALFGDAATATLVRACPRGPLPSRSRIGPFVYGTDGRGKNAFILRRGGTRQPSSSPRLPAGAEPASPGRDPGALQMDGPEIFAFTLRVVPESVNRLIERAAIAWDGVDAFVFHQANQFMLEHLRKRLGIPADKFIYAMQDCGNTTSSSIPITLRRAADEGRIRPEDTVMLVGFGVGYSWAAGLVTWCSA